MGWEPVLTRVTIYVDTRFMILDFRFRVHIQENVIIRYKSEIEINIRIPNSKLAIRILKLQP